MGGLTSLFGTTGTLDVQSLVDQLMFAERAPVRHIDRKITGFQSKIEAFNDLSTRLSSLLSTLDRLNDPDSFSAKSTQSSSESVLTASASGSAAEGTYLILVDRLALFDNFASDSGFSTSDSAIGTGSFDLQVGSTTTTITIDSTNNTLEGLKKAINASDTDVNAGIVYAGSSYQLTITSKESGSANAISILNNTLTLDDGTTPFTFSRTHNIADSSELDASLTVNGLSVTSSSNQVENVIEGVTLNLRSVSASPVTLLINNDTETVRQNIEDFVEGYNEVYSFINSQFDYVEGVGSLGLLSNEPLLRTIQSQLSGIVSSSIGGADGTYTSLYSIGVELQSDGTLVVNSTVLDEVLEENFGDLESLFTAIGETSHAQIEYLSASADTQNGTYQIDVTALPEVATVTAPNSIGATLGVDEVLTFTFGSKTSVVNLLSNMDLDTIVDTINTQFATDGAALTASRSGDNLVIDSDQTGHDISFSVVSDVASQGTGIGTTGLSDAGVSVAGTFTNTATSEVFTATGKGDILRGDQGDTEGLSIRFGGSTTGTYGTISLSFGYAEQLERLLTDLTDSLEGPIHETVEVFESNIRDLKDDILALEERLDQREANLIAKFSQANQALQQLNFLQSSLAVQLSQLISIG